MKEWFNRFIGRLLIIFQRAERATPPPSRPPPVDARDTRRARSYHEVGHALVSWHITFVSELPDILSSTDSATHSSSLTKVHCPEFYWCHILILISGFASETALNTCARPGSASRDLKTARFICSELIHLFPWAACPWRVAARRNTDLADVYQLPLARDERSILNQCFDKASELVEQRREQVLRAADELCREGRISGTRLEAIFGNRAAIRFAAATKYGLVDLD